MTVTLLERRSHTTGWNSQFQNTVSFSRNTDGENMPKCVFFCQAECSTQNSGAPLGPFGARTGRLRGKVIQDLTRPDLTQQYLHGPAIVPVLLEPKRGFFCSSWCACGCMCASSYVCRRVGTCAQKEWVCTRVRGMQACNSQSRKFPGTKRGTALWPDGVCVFVCHGAQEPDVGSAGTIVPTEKVGCFHARLVTRAVCQMEKGQVCAHACFRGWLGVTRSTDLVFQLGIRIWPHSL